MPTTSNPPAAGAGGTVLLDLTVPRGHIPRALEHRFTVRLIAANGEPAGSTSGPWKPAVTFEGGHTAVHPRRAPAIDGRVAHLLDDQLDNPPLNEPLGSDFTTETVLGNSLTIRLVDGRYATYMHLQPGSVRVRSGQRVRQGELLARVGNSGQSGGAHLHFELSAGPNPVASNGVPFELTAFSLIGRVTNVDQFLTGTASADVHRSGAPSARRGQMPLHATVVRFPH